MTPNDVQKLNNALVRADHHSPYLRLLMRRFPEVAVALASGQMQHMSPEIDPDRPVAQALRIAKGQMALAVAIGDLADVFPLETVTAHLSNFADHALDHAIAAAFEAVVPGAEPRGFAAIALGKHGSHELNYSSDIDPILIFDPQSLPCRARDEPVETAVRIGRKLLEIMQTRDGDGYVFRVDLRLRPNPDVTPIVLPVDAAISYYESSALTWERAAFIRARACAGDKALGQMFLDTIRPFVWRRGLDFGAVGEIRGMSHRIRDHYARGQAFGPGYDLKRGRGGIRECEFFAQIHQMIHGGRDASLRVPATVAALLALSQAGWIGADEAGTLSDAYRLYRMIEHRLQMVDDQQTHSLPKAGEAMDGVAMLSGLEDGAALLDQLAPYVDQVGRIYDGLDGDARDALPRNTALLEGYLSANGLADAGTVAQRIGGWRGGTYRAVRSAAAQDALEAVLPALVKALGAAADPLAAINRLDRLIERLPSAINLFRLLEARRPLLTLLTDILCHAPTLADDLSRRPDLLDGLISASALGPVGGVDQIAAQLRLDASAGLEAQLDRIRQGVGELRFALGSQIIAGNADPLEVAAGYARVAEAAVQVATDATIAEFEHAHGQVAGCEFVILALGRMGGAELTHASDLDLIFLFTGDFREESNGIRPLGAVHYFNRLAQRVTASLSVPTASGALYEIDTRLRPSGAKGPLSVSLDAFARYQAEEAWTWEHMALTRARTIYGSQQACAQAAAIVADVLSHQRDRRRLVADALKMREDMSTHKPAKSELDIKLVEGGAVDLEFALHVRQLGNQYGFDPHLGRAIAALDLPPSFAGAYQLFTRFLLTMRLVAPDFEAPTPATQALLARSCGYENWTELLAELESKRHEVTEEWRRVCNEFEGD
ncbi:MAG: bifunctional [glutamine synthetase] adenylyltransferase/[glutamine synthetase]-adenylyl-L-tyrosine phosphorylase [Pseudomonadota bacterium]